MNKIKCSVFQCEKEMDVEAREVGSVIIQGEGWRLICKDHETLVKNGTLKANKDLIYGPRNEQSNKFKRRKKEERGSEERKTEKSN